MNIRLYPLELTYGLFGVDADFPISEKVTLGPSLSLMNWTFGDVTYNGKWLGVRANYFMDSVLRDGWFVGPFVNWVRLNAGQKENAKTYKAELSGVQVGAVIGHHWMWESFNINLGGGFSYYTLPGQATSGAVGGETKDINIAGFTGAVPRFEFTIGYAF